MLDRLPPVPATDILIVDDMPEYLSLLFAILAGSGYQVRAASSGALALQAARFVTPDLVLLDIVMPEMDGYAVCAHLKADPRTADVPIIFLSALTDTRDKVRAFESGGADYITKPFEKAEVLARVQIHLARAHAEATLRVGRAQLQAIVDNAPVGVALLDAEWRVRTANRRWTDSLGLSSEASPQLALLDFAHPDDLAPRRERLEALAHGEIARYQRETRLLNSDGHMFWSDLLVAPIPNAADPIEAFVAIINDITERKQAEEQVSRQSQALAVLGERERMIRELHDTTAQALGYVNVQSQAIRELLERHQFVAAVAALDDLTRAAREAHADVRTFILGNDSTEQRQPAVLGLRAALVQCVEEFTRLTGIPAELIAAPSSTAQLLLPTADAHLLRIVQEALNNVRKHAAAAHVQVTVSVDAAGLRVTVRDDGRGFVVPTPGLRYGLRSMRERAAEIGAELRIDSAPGTGTTVGLFMPLGMTAPPREQTILLVDDHPLFIAGLRNLLVAHGLQVVGMARNGREAVERARVLRPDVVLMDIEMPHMDGLAALRQILAELPATRVVMLTAIDDERVLEAVRSGAAGYLRKDQHAEEFFEALAALARGQAPLAPGLNARLMREIARQDPPSSAEPLLTLRQQELLALLARGLTYKAIGTALTISEHTVRYHVQKIMSQLNLSSRAALIAYANRRTPPQ